MPTPEAAAVRRLATLSLAAAGGVLAVSVAPTLLPGQDAAGDGMLAGLLGLALAVAGLTFAVRAWRATTRHYAHLDRRTRWLGRAPLLVLTGLALLGLVAALAAGAGVVPS